MTLLSMSPIVYVMLQHNHNIEYQMKLLSSLQHVREWIVDMMKPPE